MDCIVCYVCQAVTQHWVVWGASHVEEVYYFCDNDCLGQWLERGRDEACRLAMEPDPSMAEKTLIATTDGLVAWKIATVPYGSEGTVPRDYQECPYYHEHGDEISCVSGSGGSMCGGFMGSVPGYVYCIWGLVGEE
jgi:hypothetical protein